MVIAIALDTAKPHNGSSYNGGNPRKGLSRKICVVDWKTGKSQNSDYSTQLYLYGLAVVNSRRWSNYEVSNLLLVEAYLLQNKFIKHSIEISQKQEIEALVSDSILNIEAVTDDHKYDLSKLKNYSYASNPISCEYCNFRSICQNLT